LSSEIQKHHDQNTIDSVPLEPKSIEELFFLENMHEICDVYLWLAERFQDEQKLNSDSSKLENQSIFDSKSDSEESIETVSSKSEILEKNLDSNSESLILSDGNEVSDVFCDTDGARKTRKMIANAIGAAIQKPLAFDGDSFSVMKIPSNNSESESDSESQ